MSFIRLQLSYLEAADIDIRRCGLICLSHLVQGNYSSINVLILGVFGEVVNAEHQLHWINENVQLLRQCGAFDPIYTLLRSSCRWMENDEYFLLKAL